MSKTYKDMKQLIASMDMIEGDVIKAVGVAVKDNIDAMEIDVRNNAPKAGDITPKIHGGAKTVDYNIGSYTFKEYAHDNADAVFGIQGIAVDLAAYIEFGTGTDAASYVPTLENSFQQQALRFYKNGKGSLAHVPFFIPAWYRIKDKLLIDAQKNINNLEIK